MSAKTVTGDEGTSREAVLRAMQEAAECVSGLVIPAHPRDPGGGETDCDVRGGCNRTKLEHKRASAHSRVAAQAGTTKDRCGNQALGSAGATGVSSLERKRKPE